MLPDGKNIEEIYELVAKFEEDKYNRTQTFDIDEVSNEIDETSSVLGIGKLGVLRLNTYKIQTNVTPINILSGTIEDVAALQQSIYIMLSIESDQYIIYPYTYGLQTLDLYGKSSEYIIAILPERITNALLSDDRVTEVSDFEFTVYGHAINVKFVVHSIYGDLDAETAVTF